MIPGSRQAVFNSNKIGSNNGFRTSIRNRARVRIAQDLAKPVPEDGRPRCPECAVRLIGCSPAAANANRGLVTFFENRKAMSMRSGSDAATSARGVDAQHCPASSGFARRRAEADWWGRAEATDLGTSSALRIMGRQWMLRLSTTSTDVASAGKPSSTLTQQFNGRRNIRSSCKCEHCVPELFAPPSLSGFHLRYVAISHNPVGIRTPGAQECQPMNLSRETRLDGPIDRTSENAGGIVMVLERFSLSASPWRQ